AAASQAGWVIEKHPGDRVLPAHVRGERLHAHRFGSVVTGKVHVDLQFFGVEKAPVRALAGDKRVEPGSSRLRDERAPGARDDPDSTDLFRTEGEEARARAKCRRQ